MKITKRISAIALALLLVLSMVACSGKTNPAESTGKAEPNITNAPSEDIGTQPSQADGVEGTWKAELDLTNVLNETIGAEMGQAVDVDTPVVIPMTVTFNNDGTYNASFDTAAAKSSMEAYLSAFVGVLTDSLYEQAEAAGMSKEDFEAAMEAEGISMDSLLDELMSEIDVDAFFEDLEDETGYYEYKDGKLWMEDSSSDFTEDNYVSVTLEGNTLKIVDINGDGASFEDLSTMGLLPIVFTKQ